MAMTAGTTALESGSMAEAIYNAFVSNIGDPGDAADTWAGIAASVAAGVVAHITANADVTITTSDAALQQASGADTTAPTANRTLASSIS